MTLFKKPTERKAKQALKIAVYGDSGAGKTKYCLSGIKNAIILNIEDGLSSAEDIDDSNVIVDFNGQLQEDGSVLQHTDEDGNKLSVPEVFGMVKTEVENMLNDSSMHFDTIIVDSYSMYSQKLFAYLDGDGKAYHEILSSNHEWLMGLPINKVIIFQIGEVAEGVYIKKAPTVVGSSFKQAIPYFYDTVIKLESDPATHERSLISNGTSEVVAKNRLDHRFKEKELSLQNFKNMQEVIDYLK